MKLQHQAGFKVCVPDMGWLWGKETKSKRNSDLFSNNFFFFFFLLTLSCQGFLQERSHIMHPGSPSPGSWGDLCLLQDRPMAKTEPKAALLQRPSQAQSHAPGSLKQSRRGKKKEKEGNPKSPTAPKQPHTKI